MNLVGYRLGLVPQQASGGYLLDLPNGQKHIICLTTTLVQVPSHRDCIGRRPLVLSNRRISRCFIGYARPALVVICSSPQLGTTALIEYLS